MDLTILFLLTLGGLPVLISYYFMVKKLPINTLWANMPNWLRIIDYFTIFCAFIAGIYLIYYSIEISPTQNKIVHHTYEPYGKYILYTAWTLLLIGANLWPLSLIHQMKPIWVVGSLILTTIGASLLMDCVLNGQTNGPWTTELILATVASSILLFQTGIMDMIIWNYFYLR